MENPAPSLKNHAKLTLPPIKLSAKKFQMKPAESLSNRLKLYFQLRTSSKITINNPIECLLPSTQSPSLFSSAFLPSPADIVMSALPPKSFKKDLKDFKFSRLFNEKSQNNNNFLRKSIKANERIQNPLKQRRDSYHSVHRHANHQQSTIPRLSSKSSIPFLSDLLNRVYKQSSKMLFSPNGLAEFSGTNDRICIEKSMREAVIEFDTPKYLHKTLDAPLQTETLEHEEEKSIRRVIFNKNSSFIKKESAKLIRSISSSSSDD